MMKKLGRILWAAMALCGILCSAILLCSRMSAEWDDRHATAAVFYHEIQELAQESGLPEEEWLAAYGNNGVRHVVFLQWPEDEVLSVMESLSMTPACVGGAEGDWAFVIPNEEEGLDTTAPLVLIEDHDRTSVILPKTFDLNAYEGKTVKAFYLFPDYMNCYSEEVGGQEYENRLFRAVMERGMRLLLLTPLTDLTGTQRVLDPDVYAQALSGLTERLARRGVTFGETFSCLDGNPFNPLLVWGAGLLAAALWVFLLTRFKWLKNWTLPLCLAAVIVIGEGCFLLPYWAQKALMFFCAVGFPCTVVYGAWRFSQRTEPLKRPAALNYLAGVAALFAWNLLGGLAVSALMSDRYYMMGALVFTGVKAAEFLPLILCVVLFGIPAVKQLRGKKLTVRRVIPLLIFLAVCAVAGTVLLRRAGDIGDSISGGEKAVRDALEHTLYIRPRTKEWLFGVPLAALLMTKPGRKYKLVALVGGLGCCLTCVSVTNTLCHAVAPVYVSLMRVLLGTVLGCVLGLVIVGVCALIFRKKIQS